MVLEQQIIRAGRLARSASLLLVAGLWPKQDFADVDKRVSALSVPAQSTIVAAVLAALFCTAMIAAQFGWLGMGIYWMLIILIAR